MPGVNKTEGKIRAVWFDLDGVLLDTRELHFVALNKAIMAADPKYEITKEMALDRYDGMPTKVKLQMMTDELGLPTELHQQIYTQKQAMTQLAIDEVVTVDEGKVALMKALRERGLTIGCCSNSITETIENLLTRCGVREYFDFIKSNQMAPMDVNPKPNPAVYLQCCAEHGLSPFECLVVEDSPMGRTAAFMSRCHVMPVLNHDEVTEESVLACIAKCEEANAATDFEFGGQLRSAAF